jgi:RHS repeat-associated protein
MAAPLASRSVAVRWFLAWRLWDKRRVKKETSGEIRACVYNAQGQLAAEYTSGAPTGSGTSDLTTDHLGSTRIMTDAAGNPKTRHDYLPFGEEIPLTSTNYGNRLSIPGYTASPIDGPHQKFTAKERDTESNLDYFGARYFSGAQGRFTSPDPLLNSGRPDDPHSWNRYAYVSNNPLKFVDPRGLYKFAVTCGENDTACREQQDRFREGIKNVRTATNNLEKGSKERKRLDSALKKIGETEGKGATIAFGDAGETNGLANLGRANIVTNAITFNLGAIDEYTKNNPNIQSDSDSANFFTAVIGHEGGHLAGNIPLLGKVGIRNYFQSATERQALTTESYVYQGLRFNDPQGLLWNNSWLKVDRQQMEQLRRQGVEEFFKKPAGK